MFDESYQNRLSTGDCSSSSSSSSSSSNDNNDNNSKISFIISNKSVSQMYFTVFQQFNQENSLLRIQTSDKVLILITII